jgi:hypothetical protein
MKFEKYTADNTLCDTGAIGLAEAQSVFGTQLIATQPFSIQGNREFNTYVNAENYIKYNSTAFPGIIVTVSYDGENNGAYLVEHIDLDETIGIAQQYKKVLLTNELPLGNHDFDNMKSMDEYEDFIDYAKDIYFAKFGNYPTKDNIDNLTHLKMSKLSTGSDICDCNLGWQVLSEEPTEPTPEEPVEP